MFTPACGDKQHHALHLGSEAWSTPRMPTRLLLFTLPPNAAGWSSPDCGRACPRQGRHAPMPRPSRRLASGASPTPQSTPGELAGTRSQGSAFLCVYCSRAFDVRSYSPFAEDGGEGGESRKGGTHTLREAGRAFHRAAQAVILPKSVSGVRYSALLSLLLLSLVQILTPFPPPPCIKLAAPWCPQLTSPLSGAASQS